MDLDKLAQELGGKPVSDLDALAAELGGEVASTPGGYGATTLAKDVGKLVTSGAVKGVAGAPETVQAAGSTAARESLFAPTEALNLIADPRRLANKLVGSVGLPPIFETTKEQPLVPAQVTEKQRAAVDETLSKGKIPQLRQLTEFGNRLSENIENTISPEMRLAMAESQPTGNIIKALETGDFSEVSMGKNPTALGLTGQAVKVFGTSAPALLTALVTKSTGPATAVGFGQAGAEGIDEARNYIKNMSDEELAKKSEYFRNLIALGYSTNQARQMTEDKAADTASLAQGSVGALGGAFTAKLLQGGFDKTLLGSAKSRLGKVLQGAGIAGAEGAITEMAEGVATDLGIDKTVVREIGVDSFANLVLGAIGEAAPGVIRGAVAPGEKTKGAEAPEVPPIEPSVTPVTVAPVEGAAPAIIPEGGFETEEEAAAPAVTPTAAPAAEAPAKKPLLPEKKPNDPAIEAEGMALADELKSLGDDASANGLRSNLERFGGYTEPKQLQYYKDKLLEAQQKAGKAPEMPKETFNTRNFILNYKADKDRFEKFLPKAPQQVQDTIAKSDQYIQALTDKINAAGYKVTDVNPTSPQELIKLRRMISGIGGTSFRYLLDAQHVARNNRYANPEKVAQAEKQLAKDFAKVDQLLGAAPTPVEEVTPTPEEMAPKATEVVTEPTAETPKFAVDEQGEKLRYPMFVDLADKGYQLYSFENPRTYENKGGVKYRTLEKDGVRIALEPQQLLFTDPKYPNRQPQLGMGTEKDVAFHFIGVDPELRKQGKAKQALQDLIEIADKNDFTLYGEPAQLEKEGMTAEQLTNLYKRYGFKPTDETNKVIVREPGAKGEEVAITPAPAPTKAEINRQRQAEKRAAAEAKKAKPVEKKKPEVKEAHVEGKTKEPITSKTIEEAIDKAEAKVDAKKIKQAVKNQFDQAIKKATILTDKAWSEAKGLPDEEAYVNISIPGDGKFKVKNNKERLEEFKKRLTAAIPLKEGKPRREPSAASVSAADVAFKNMVDEGDMEAAIEYAKLQKLDLDPKAGEVKLNPEQRKKIEGFFGTKEKYAEYKREIGKGEEPELPMIEPGTYEKAAPEIIEEVRQEKISEYAQARAATRRITKKVAKYGSDIPLQKELNTLLEIEEELKDYLDATKPTRNSAEDFMARATKELADGNISPEVEGFIRTTFEKYPKVLEGLRLSVRSQKDEGRQAGNFNPYRRIVTLWKEGSGVEDPKTVRHELTHSLELMMSPETKKVLVDQWARAFEQAMKVHTDKQSQKYFDAVLEFLADPTKENLDKATKVMPSYDFYQYMNPSEYWAVNAEAMLGAKLGGAWSRFTNGLKKLLEGLKSFFGMNNKYELHKAMDKLLKGEAPRAGEETLVDYLTRGKYKLDYLANVEDTDALLEKHNRPRPPIHPSQPVKDAFMGGYDKAKNTVRNIQQEPLMATNNMIGKVDRAITEQRNKNIFYGTGLELADRARYGGQVRNGHKQAIASVALVNAIHSGHIATQVMTQGKLIFNQDTQMFQADKSDKSMANVVRAKAKLVEKLGDVRAAKVIQAFFEAKRSRSIINEYLDRTAAYEAAIDSGESVADASRDLKNIEIAMQKIQMTDEAIDDFIKLDQKYPELKEMMDNWTAVNQNMIDMMEFSGLISKQRAKTLRGIKDYVPWYRVMDDMDDVHSAPGGTRGMTNVSREKKFKSGEVDRDIDDIVDNMIHNVLMLTRNSMRNYAANRIVMEYGTRNEKGKIKVFPSEGADKDGVRFNIVAAGKRIVVQIKDPLVAEAVIGMENIDIPMINALAYLANGLRRSITTFPAFQIAQLFMDAPTAALVTGLKNPGKVWAGVFTSFLKNLRKDDPIVAKLRSYGIGGYQSSARTPEKEIQMDIGLIKGSWFAKAMKGLDRFGDASDYAQRRAVYMQTLKETGDELLAIFQANNVIDFQKRGSGGLAQAVTRSVAFMNAYAQSIDVLAKGLAGGGIKGLSRRQAIARMAATGMALSAATLVYCMLVGDDDEYNKLDDQTKMRNIYIPGLNMRLPMHTGASFFFKAIPELIYNAVMKEGTKDEYDAARLKRALGKSALDSLLGPNITPTGVKPVVEIILNKNFFTGGQVTPKGMEDLAAFRQYNQNTSELGKVISSLTGTEKTRLLNPMEADHLVRGLLGTAGAAAMWGTNMLIGNRPEPQAKDNPFYGQFIMPDVARGREDLYYDLKGKTDEAYKTHQDLLKKGRKEEAAEWFKENKDLIKIYGYTSSIETNLKELNGEIRRLSDLPEGKMDPKQKRERINELQEIKMRVLKDVISMRKRAGL